MKTTWQYEYDDLIPEDFILPNEEDFLEEDALFDSETERDI